MDLSRHEAYGGKKLNAQLEEQEDDPKFEEAVFGREVREFIENDRIGKYLISKAQEDIAEAAHELLTVDPTDMPKIRAIQNRAAVANAVRDWLRQAIQDGENAVQAIQQERDTRG